MLILDYILRTKKADLAADITDAAGRTDREPTEAQREAGNYRKGKVAFHGFTVSIENPRGSVRSGVGKDGKAWRTRMKAHYGYFLGTKGKDKDHVDVFIGSRPECELFFVINQLNDAGELDEHKVIAGALSESEARELYLMHYEAGWQGLGSVKAMTLPQFRQWVYEADLTKRATLITEEEMAYGSELETAASGCRVAGRVVDPYAGRKAAADHVAEPCEAGAAIDPSGGAAGADVRDRRGDGDRAGGPAGAAAVKEGDCDGCREGSGLGPSGSGEYERGDRSGGAGVDAGRASGDRDRMYGVRAGLDGSWGVPIRSSAAGASDVD